VVPQIFESDDVVLWASRKEAVQPTVHATKSAQQAQWRANLIAGLLSLI
jgi:hypothetical protein